MEGPWVLESFYAPLWDLFSLLWEGGHACWGCREGDVVLEALSAPSIISDGVGEDEGEGERQE